MPLIEPFGGAATQKDADIIRERFDQFVHFVAPGSTLDDPLKRQKLFTAAAHVVELTAELAVIHQTVPGYAGRLFGVLISGVEKDPGTGKVGAKRATVNNFAPSPIGFLDPTAVGLPRNFYLPAGSTNFIPEAADRIGLGLPEQRLLDEQSNARQRVGQSLSDLHKAQAIVANESRSGLELIVGPNYPFQRGARIAAANEIPRTVLVREAGAELARRDATDTTQLTPLIAGLATSLGAFNEENAQVILGFQDLAAALDEEEIRINPFLRVGGGAPLPEDAPSVHTLIADAQKHAVGPMKFVEGSRADP